MLILKLYCLGMLCLSYIAIKKPRLFFNVNTLSAFTQQDVASLLLMAFCWPAILIIMVGPVLVKERKWFWQA